MGFNTLVNLSFSYSKVVISTSWPSPPMRLGNKHQRSLLTYISSHRSRHLSSRDDAEELLGMYMPLPPPHRAASACFCVYRHNPSDH